MQPLGGCICAEDPVHLIVHPLGKLTKIEHRSQTRKQGSHEVSQLALVLLQGALALEGKAEDFRELMMAYNRNAAPYADANQTEMFGERPTKEDFVTEFLKLRNWEDYETRHSSKEGNGDAGSSEGTEPQARGGSEPTEGQREVNKAVKRIATEITKQTGKIGRAHV